MGFDNLISFGDIFWGTPFLMWRKFGFHVVCGVFNFFYWEVTWGDEGEVGMRC